MNIPLDESTKRLVKICRNRVSEGQQFQSGVEEGVNSVLNRFLASFVTGLTGSFRLSSDGESLEPAEVPLGADGPSGSEPPPEIPPGPDEK